MALTIKTIAIIGCGGVASHIIPALIHQFNLILVDGDKYEPKNVTRQLAAATGDGKNKAEVLRDIYQPYAPEREILVVPQYLDQNTQLPAHDLMLVAVDNHDARVHSADLARTNFVPMIWAANEEYDPQAFMFLPEWAGSNRDPIVRMGITPDGRSPLASCNSQEALDEKPQLAIANNVAGAYMLQMVHALQVINKMENLPAEIIGSPNAVNVRRFKEIAMEVTTPQAMAAQEIAQQFG